MLNIKVDVNKRGYRKLIQRRSFLTKSDFLIPKYVLKVGLLPSEKVCFICFNKSLLKIIKNAFYFILKAPFVLKIFKFLSRLFDHIKKGLIRKIRLISKLMASQPR